MGTHGVFLSLFYSLSLWMHFKYFIVKYCNLLWIYHSERHMDFTILSFKLTKSIPIFSSSILLDVRLFATIVYGDIGFYLWLFGFILRNLGAKIISFSPLIDALLAICVHTRNNSCWNCHQVEADTAVEFLGEFRIQCRLRLCSNCSLKLLYSFNALHQIS